MSCFVSIFCESSGHGLGNKTCYRLSCDFLNLAEVGFYFEWSSTAECRAYRLFFSMLKDEAPFAPALTASTSPVTPPSRTCEYPARRSCDDWSALTAGDKPPKHEAPQNLSAQW
jgi:hypothetical protein